MAEISIAYQLVTPAGTLNFNAAGADYYWLTNVQGMDAPHARSQVQGLAARDGAVVFDAYQDAIYPVLEGTIVHSSVSQRGVLERQLTAWLPSILRADGTLKWTATGSVAKQRTVRLLDGPSIGGGYQKTFQFALVAGDPPAYSQTLTTSADITVNGSALSITNAGDTSTWPTLRIYGAVTNPQILNLYTGQNITFSGITIANGTYVEIDTRTETAVLASTGALVDGSIATNVTPFQLYPGSGNSVSVTGTSPGVNAKLVVLYRNAYAS